jgi:transcriptional regulator with XRE-family HTH domain
MTNLLEVPPAQAIKQLQSDLNLTMNELAGALQTSSRTIQRWQKSGTHPQHGARRRLAYLVALDRHLRETFGSPAGAQAWLHTSNRHLGGMTPADAMRAGRIDRVEAALEALDSGIFV